MINHLVCIIYFKCQALVFGRGASYDSGNTIITVGIYFTIISIAKAVLYQNSYPAFCGDMVIVFQPISPVAHEFVIAAARIVDLNANFLAETI